MHAGQVVLGLSTWQVSVMAVNTKAVIWSAKYSEIDKVGYKSAVFKFYVGAVKYRFISPSGVGKRIFEVLEVV